MEGVAECPSCGEGEELRGEPCEGDIRITCSACGARWVRGAPRCAGCGGQDLVERPQAMTRYSRGTQLSIIGWRDLPLCRGCDTETLQTSLTQNTPVPGDYVSVCLYGHEGRRTAAQPPPRPVPDDPPPPRAAAPSAPASALRGKPPQPASPPARARAERARPRPAPSAVPTVRQAIAAFLSEATEVDHTAMLLLGTHLGSYNRLGVLDEADAAETMAAWCDGHWPDAGAPSAERALGTIRRAVDFWGARGWLVSDPAGKLR